MADDAKAPELELSAGPLLNEKSSSSSGLSAVIGPRSKLNDGLQDHQDVQDGHEDVEKGSHLTSHAEVDEGSDPNLVDWQGENDPENPMHWSFKRKLWMSIMASFMTFGVSFASSVWSANTEVTAAAFGVSEEVTILGVSLYVLGFACGPLVFAPVSELFGRSRPLLFGFFCSAIFNIPVAVAQNIETVLVCRFLTGAFGGAPVAIAPGILVDLWEPYARGIANLLWAMTVFAGPTFGPVIGEFVVKNPSMGWRWNLWITLIMNMSFFMLSLPTISETFAPVLLQRKAARLRFETRNWALHSKRDEEPVQYGYLVRKYGIKPLQMLVQEPILAAMTSFMALAYAIIYLTFFAFPYSFAVVRGWEIGISALPFFGLLIGYLLGFVIAMLESRIRFRKLLRKHDGKVAPEERLPPMALGSVFLVGGLFWFAWTSSPNVSWVPQVIAGVPVGCGIFMVFMPGQVYLMDIYTVNAASALAGNAFTRAALACAFPLFGNQMYRRLGAPWATSLLGFLCLAMAPFPVVLYFYGAKIRSWSKYTVDST